MGVKVQALGLDESLTAASNIMKPGRSAGDTQTAVKPFFKMIGRNEAAERKMVRQEVTG